MYVSLHAAVPLAAIDPPEETVLSVPVRELGLTVGHEPVPGAANVPLTQSYTATLESESCELPFVITPSTPT